MRSIPFTFCGAAVVAVTLMPASVALADTGSGQEKDSQTRSTLSVDPSSIAPGGEVDLQFDGCKGEKAKGSPMPSTPTPASRRPTTADSPPRPGSVRTPRPATTTSG